MKKLSLIIALCISAISFAQMSNNRGTISGHLTDFEADGAPLAFATVEVIGTNLTATTDFDGSFTIAGLEPGTYELKVRFLGYQDLKTEALYIEANHTKEINYSLKAIQFKY